VIIRLKNKKGILVLVLLSILVTGCAENKALVKRKSQALENLGKSRILQGDLREGLEKLLEASRLDPENANIHNELGLVYRNLGIYEKSIVHFKRALALQPEFPEAQNNLGTVYGLVKELVFRQPSNPTINPSPMHLIIRPPILVWQDYISG
jgi:lipoprotein NlpI